jgi:beta-glucanase (GH16 family)
MGRRRVPAGSTRTARLAALLSVVLTISSGLLLGTSGAASAQSGAPTVSVRLTDTDAVSVSGRTRTASPRVRFERLSGAGWAFVKGVRARSHRYAATLWVAGGTTQTFRVTANHRTRKFVVSAPERKGPGGSTSTTTPTTTTTPTAKPPAPVKSDDCGPRPVKADGSAWSCTFHDDFDGTALDRSKWIPNTAFVTWSGDTHACYRDDPANVNVAGGSLNLSLVKLDAPAPCGVALSPTQYMAGSVSTYHLFSQQYGRFEARIKTAATSSPGLHEAFWLWPDDRYSTIGWPDSGEIDVAESFSNYASITGSYLHYSADHLGLFLGTNAANCTANRGEWNTYTVDWTPSRIETFVNGTSCLVNTSGDAAFQKRYIINLTQAIGGASWNLLGTSTPLPATMQVDYVRVWQ